MKKTLILFVVLSFLSCSEENPIIEGNSNKQSLTIKGSTLLEKKSSTTSKTASTSIVSSSSDDEIFRRKLIELEAEYNRCIGNPSYGSITYPGNVVITTGSGWSGFKSSLTQEFQTTFAGAWGLYVNQAYFNVPIIRTKEAMPSSNDFYYMISGLEYSNLPCYVQYLNEVKALYTSSQPPM